MEKLTVSLQDKNIELLIQRGNFSENIDAMQAEGRPLITSEELGSLLPWFLQKSHLNLWIDLAFVYENDGDADILIVYGNNPVLQEHQRAIDAAYNGKAFHLYEDTWEALKNAASTEVEEAIRSGVLRVKRENMPKELPINAELPQEPVV